MAHFTTGVMAGFYKDSREPWPKMKPFTEYIIGMSNLGMNAYNEKATAKNKMRAYLELKEIYRETDPGQPLTQANLREWYQQMKDLKKEEGGSFTASHSNIRTSDFTDNETENETVVTGTSINKSYITDGGTYVNRQQNTAKRKKKFNALFTQSDEASEDGKRKIQQPRRLIDDKWTYRYPWEAEEQEQRLNKIVDRGGMIQTHAPIPVRAVQAIGGLLEGIGRIPRLLTLQDGDGGVEAGNSGTKSPTQVPPRSPEEAVRHGPPLTGSPGQSKGEEGLCILM